MVEKNRTSLMIDKVEKVELAAIDDLRKNIEKSYKLFTEAEKIIQNYDKKINNLFEKAKKLRGTLNNNLKVVEKDAKIEELKVELEATELKPGTVHTVQTLAAAEPGFNEGGIRWVIFQHKSKLVDEGAIFFVGKKLLIDRDRYVSLLKEGGLTA